MLRRRGARSKVGMCIGPISILSFETIDHFIGAVEAKPIIFVTKCDHPKAGIVDHIVIVRISFWIAEIYLLRNQASKIVNSIDTESTDFLWN